MWTAIRTKDSNIKKFATSSHTPSPFSIKDACFLFQYKRSLNSNSGKMVLWNSSPPSSWSAGFTNKVTVPCPNKSSLSLLVCCTASSMSLGLDSMGKENQDSVLSLKPRGRHLEKSVCVGNVQVKEGLGYHWMSFTLTRGFAALPEICTWNKQPYDIVMKCRKSKKSVGGDFVLCTFPRPLKIPQIFYWKI